MNDAAQELIGRTLGGRFRLTAFLGEGAMASVFQGEQDGDPRQVAVKVMHPELLRDATFAKRFTREAKAAARIEHRNSVRILEHGADGELLYLAMELLGGQDLFEVLARAKDRRLPPARAARIVVQVCGALTAAHAHGIVHRDLKPENVMILADPDDPEADLVKVLDFGIAKILDRDRGPDEEPSSKPVESMPPSSMLTLVGGLVGTPEYMSPEQTRGLPVDARSDVYACGVLLFVVVTGKAPFNGAHPVDIMMQHVDKAPPAPSSLVPGLHPGLEEIILKALAKAPSERQQSAAELAAELGAVLAELEAAPSTQALPTQKLVARMPSSPGSDRGAAPAPEAAPPNTMRSPPQGSGPATFEKTLIVPESPAASGDKKPSAPPVVVETKARPRVELDRTLVIGEDLAAVAPAPAAPVKAAPVKAAPAAVATFNRTLVLEEAQPPAPPAAAAGDFDKTLVIPEQAVAMGETPKPPAQPVAPPAPKPTATAAPAPEPDPAARPVAVRARSPVPSPAPLVPAEAHWIAPWWMYAFGVTVICVLLWVVRYLRFGAE